MYYLLSRYYDPAVGRFINADGYASTGQGIIGNNMFAYCGNNPVNSVDSAGNMPRTNTQHYTEAMVFGANNSRITIVHLPSPPIYEDAGTFSAGVSGSTFCGYGAGVSGGIAVDGTGNAGLVGTVTGGAGTPSSGVGVFLSYTTAPTIEKLSGRSEVVGGSISFLIISIGFEYSIFNDEDTNEAYHGFTFLIGGPSATPFETHGGVSMSGIWDF